MNRFCYSVDNKSGKELRQYLAHLSEQAAAGDNNVLPCVVVLDNLHKAGPLADALGSLPRNLPCLLGIQLTSDQKNVSRTQFCFRYYGTISMFRDQSSIAAWF